MSRTPALVSVLLISFTVHAIATDPSGEPDLVGDWVGWAYLDEGGDLPLRLRVDRDAKGLRVRFDELVSKRYDLPAEVAWEPPRLIVTRERPTGSRIVLDGTLEGGTIRGRIDWGGHQGDFDLSRSLELIARIPPELLEGLTGTYRLSAERSLVVTSRFWGELLVTDLATGRYATLLPSDADEFFLGSAMYVPAPIHARVRFRRNDDGEAVAVDWDEVSGPSLSGPRSLLVEEEVAFESDSVELVGTLIRPASPGRFPAVVVLPGSNWTDREAGRRDAEILASFGMAALVYDKRGNGESGGEPTVPFRQTARDAAAAVAVLADREDVISDQVGITGRSRGGWFAPLAATMAPEAAFVILFVPPAVSPAAQETTRRLNLLRDEGYSAEQIEAARSMLAATWRYAATSEGWEAYAATRERAAAAGLPEEIFEPADAGDPEWEWTRLNMTYDPIPALESLRVPLLALFGEKDRNVVVAENLPAMREALERGDNSDFELFVVPGANHGLRDVSASGDLPLHRQVGFGSAGWPKIARWLGERLDLVEPE
ncbi:MAG TPA: CocE/NonD family hydrolase [Thermoanaerobaculia bacterium]|nr:CocE/NonD family hydrolase [Thermoanaerobaculia bacterium]